MDFLEELMKINHLLVLLTISLSALGRGQEVIKTKLGGKFTKVWFGQPGLTGNAKALESFPLVGIDFSPDVLLKRIVAATSLPIEGTALAKAFKTEFLGTSWSDASLFCIERGGVEACQVTYQYYDEDAEMLHLVLAGPGNSYNASYTIKFRLSDFLKKYGLVSGMPDTLLHDDTELVLSNRVSVELGTNLQRAKTTLITTAKDEADAATLSFDMTIKGFANPLARPIFGGKPTGSFHDFNLSAVLSENNLDSQSRIQASLIGSTGFLALKNAVSLSGARVTTSQNARQVDVAYDFAWRFGDKRAKGKWFTSNENVLETLYAELGVQVGGSFYKRVKGVTDPERFQQFLARPRLRLGVHEKNLFSPYMNLVLSGYLDLYGVFGRYGGSETFDGIGRVFAIEVGLGPKSNRISFTAEGGQNPAQGFVNIRPTYSLKYKFKF